MALNFTVSYTFSPGTTISSSQVNTNTTDVASVFQGLEAETKTLAKLKVDIDPTLALEVATKQYVDHYSAWRRPILQWTSVTVVDVQSGLNGTSSAIPIQFPDGTMRTETVSTRTTFDITRNAVLVTSGAQSGLTGATSEAINTWYALYAVKVTDSSTLWVTVGSTVLPLQANFATLNTAYGTSGWVYLGLIRNGDNSGSTGDILNFAMVGNRTYFKNTLASTPALTGTLLATTAGASTLSWAYASGTGTAQVPSIVVGGMVIATATARAAAGYGLSNSAGTQNYSTWDGGPIATIQNMWIQLGGGLLISNNAAATSDGFNFALGGFDDYVLGVGSNPLL